MPDILSLALVLIACATSVCAVVLLRIFFLLRQMVRTYPLVQAYRQPVPAAPLR